MDDDSFRVAEMLLQGFTCGHIIMKLALEAQGRDNPDLVRAMSGLAKGMGVGFNCGCLTAGSCVLGMYAGRSKEGEPPHERFDAMLEEFSNWFGSEVSGKYEGIDCSDIMKFDPALKQQRCPGLIADSWTKIKEILAKNNLDISEPPQADC